MKEIKKSNFLCIAGVLLLCAFALSGCASFIDFLIDESLGSNDCVDDDWVWCDDDDDGEEEYVLCESCWEVECCDDDEDGC